MLTQEMEDLARYAVRNRIHPINAITYIEALLAEIDRLRQKVTEHRVLASMVVEDTIKLYSKAKGLQHAIEKGKEPQGRLAEHKDGNGRWTASETGGRHCAVEGRQKSETFDHEAWPFDIS